MKNIQVWFLMRNPEIILKPFKPSLGITLPGHHGAHLCKALQETGCNRNHIDNTVNIHATERFIGDEAIRQGWTVRFHAQPTGKSAGDRSRTRADCLRLITSPAWAMPLMFTMQGRIPEDYCGRRAGLQAAQNILDAEIGRLMNMGINFRLNYTVADLQEEKETADLMPCTYRSVRKRSSQNPL